MSTIRRIAIVANRTKPGVPALIAELERVAKGAGVETLLPDSYPLRAGALKGCDACAVLGGDGTLLGVVSQAVEWQVPVFGINRGKLGFLAHYASEDAGESLLAVLRGDCQIDRRILLECRTRGGCRALALNDVVVKTRNHSRMMRLQVASGGEFVSSYRCDGLIVTTPTGSTAYNLSAGGPLIDPGADVFAITPICPHTLSDRSLILPRGRSITVAADEESEGFADITVDGVQFGPECTQFPLEIRLSEQTMPIIQPKGFSHFKLLRDKLRWA
ncbi:MAG: NAD(+)/NADH kinase [Puniceicoccales bacterium]|jgi:NAD+ kinase|nr:NAD(+)/NADH kinase [Puniceicoccales bacterium]